MNSHYTPYPSIRGWFAYELHKQMAKNKAVWLVTGDLGYKMWDHVQEDYAERFINVGAAEQTMMGVAVGLALENKIPFVYSITTFLLYRSFETIRNYINNESIPVRLVGSGRNRDYAHDGFSHWGGEDKKVMKIFNNVKSAWPETKEEIPDLVGKMVEENRPWYINLRR